MHTMKKRIISIFLILILMFSALPAAQAESSVNLGNTSAGTEIKLYISNVSDDIGTVDSIDLPSGCYLEREDGRLYLCGAPFFAGPYSFELSSGDFFHVFCTLNVLPAIPSVEACADVACEIGSSSDIYVNVYIEDGGELSYQWYMNSSRSTSGGLPVGENSSWYTPDTNSAGTTYYYCEVTNNNSGYTASAISAPVTVTVRESGPVSISVSSMPSRTEYTVGDMLDPGGLTIQVDYSDHQEYIDSDFKLEPMQLKTAGIQSILVSYEGKTCSFPVKVKEKEIPRKLEIVSRPAKLNYQVGDWLDTKGLKLRVTEGDRSTEVTTGFSCSPNTLNTTGTQNITVKYDGLTCNFNVQVEEARKEISISVKSLPTRTNYSVGESLDTSGLVLTLTTTDGTESLSSGFTCYPASFNAKGRQLVEVRYKDLSCTFVVNISEKAATPTPSPTAAPEPTQQPAEPSAEPTPAPTASPQPSHTQTEKKSSSGAVIVLVVSVIALIGLSAYVLIMNNGGIEGVIDIIRRYFKR